jgi:hypothetical protein
MRHIYQLNPHQHAPNIYIVVYGDGKINLNVPRGDGTSTSTYLTVEQARRLAQYLNEIADGLSSGSAQS